MRILLINPSVGYYTLALSNPLGLLSIGTYLKQNGHDVKIYDRCVDKTKLSDVLKTFSPDIVGVSILSSRGIKDAIKVSKHIKKKTDKLIVWGGQIPSMQTDLVLETDYVDLVSVNEGEETWKELVHCLENNESIYDIQGLAYKKDGKIIQNPCRPFADLRDMPITDWSLIDVPKYMQAYLGCDRMMYIYTSKGCPCKCAFCPNPSFHKSIHRKRPNEYVIEEVKYLIENYDLDGAYFSDELWCVKKSDMREFCRMVHENNLDFHWGVELRIGMFDEEDFQTMYDAGCRWIYFGIETASEEMSKKIHKNIDMAKVQPTVEALNRIGITSFCSFIIGFPDETEDQLKETIKVINTIGADLKPIHHFTPIPGSELYNEVVSQNKYKGAERLEDLAKVVATENVGKNLSKVPTKDLRVIRSWYNWKAFTSKSTSYSKPFEFAIQTIISGLRSISLKGPIYFLVNGFSALREFLYVFWYSHAYPGIRKKYDLK